MTDNEKKRWDPDAIWDAQLPHIHSATVRDALERFPLPLANGKDWDWVALAVRRSLAISIPSEDESPDRQPNTETRRELQRLADRCDKLWLALVQTRSREAESAIFKLAFRRWNRGEDSHIQRQDGWKEGGPAEWRRFEAALGELDWLSSFLRSAARELPIQKPRWTETERRRVRLQRALYLAPIFLTAFEMNSLPGKFFGDFYQRMVSLAFGEHDIPDFEALIADARQMHEHYPTSFRDGLIPGLDS